MVGGFAHSRAIDFAHDIRMLFRVVKVFLTIFTDIHCVHELVTSQRWNDTSYHFRLMICVKLITSTITAKFYSSLKATLNAKNPSFNLRLNYPEI